MSRADVLARWAPLALVTAGLIALRTLDIGRPGAEGDAAVLVLGYLLLAAWILGLTAAHAGLPKITGYLAAGLIAGPYASGLLTTDMMTASKAVEGVAVGLIALTAGGELRLDWLKKRAKRLLTITFAEMTLVAAGIMGLLLLAAPLFPFMPDDDLTRGLVIAFVFGAIAVANSPTVTIAVIAETRAEGPVSRTVLGVTIVKDMCVIVLFAAALAVAKSSLGGESSGSLPLTLAWELGGSVLVGFGVGALISLFLTRIGRDVPIFVIAVAFAISELSSALHLEALLVALSAGFWVENFSKRAKGHDLIEGIEKVALPVFALFFAAAGAKVDLGALAALWPLALLLVAARGALVWTGTWIGTRLSGAEPEVRRWAWLGFVSQAGVSLALAATVARAFPGWGDTIQVLILAMIAIHEVLGPIGFQFALKRAGEAGKQAPSKARQSNH